MKTAITLLLLSALALAAHAKPSYEGHQQDYQSKQPFFKPEYKPQYKPEYKKPDFKQAFKAFFKPQPPQYYCTYFYYDNGYCPSGDWYQTFQTAVDTYAQSNQDVYGCSFGNQYNYGYQSDSSTQGGYVCFKTQESPMKFWNWFYGSQYCTDFAPYNSDYCHYKVVTSDNLPTCQYTYNY